MDNFHHKPIKRFQLDGSIHDEASIPRLRNEYIRLVSMEMKLSGYAIRLDINPDFTIQFNYKTETFTFNLSLYGVYVGKKKAEWILGIDGTKAIFIAKNKSSESLQDQGSQLNQK